MHGSFGYFSFQGMSISKRAARDRGSKLASPALYLSQRTAIMELSISIQAYYDQRRKTWHILTALTRFARHCSTRRVVETVRILPSIKVPSTKPSNDFLVVYQAYRFLGENTMFERALCVVLSAGKKFPFLSFIHKKPFLAFLIYSLPFYYYYSSSIAII